MGVKSLFCGLVIPNVSVGQLVRNHHGRCVSAEMNLRNVMMPICVVMMNIVPMDVVIRLMNQNRKQQNRTNVLAEQRYASEQTGRIVARPVNIAITVFVPMFVPAVSQHLNVVPIQNVAKMKHVLVGVVSMIDVMVSQFVHQMQNVQPDIRVVPKGVVKK